MRGSHPRGTLVNSLPPYREETTYFHRMFVTYHGEVKKLTENATSPDLEMPSRITAAKQKRLARKTKYMTRALTGGV